MNLDNAHVTLSEAARHVPGRPSANCLWRWCRRGVLARSGERVRLKHVRLGGRIYTTLEWVDQFGQRLAEADAGYFDLDEQDESVVEHAPHRRSPRSIQKHDEHLAAVNQELDEEGL